MSWPIVVTVEGHEVGEHDIHAATATRQSMRMPPAAVSGRVDRCHRPRQDLNKRSTYRMPATRWCKTARLFLGCTVHRQPAHQGFAGPGRLDESRLVLGALLPCRRRRLRGVLVHLHLWARTLTNLSSTHAMLFMPQRAQRIYVTEID